MQFEYYKYILSSKKSSETHLHILLIQPAFYKFQYFFVLLPIRTFNIPIIFR